jgi:hypothetical protein
VFNLPYSRERLNSFRCFLPTPSSRSSQQPPLLRRSWQRRETRDVVRLSEFQEDRVVEENVSLSHFSSELGDDTACVLRSCWRRWGWTTKTAEGKELSAITSAGHAFDFEVSLVEATVILSYFVQGSSGERKEGRGRPNLWYTSKVDTGVVG